jgi:hypothetical protein
MIAFSNKQYGEMILHPPPLSYSSLILILFSWNKQVSARACLAFSYCMFWIENFFFMTFFLTYEFILFPIVYTKVFVNILRSPFGMFTLMFYTGFWLFLGPLLILIYIMRDCWYLFLILKMHNGCQSYYNIE